MINRPIRTRIAPSPTGFLHLGTARTALFSWAFARHHGGTFVLRIEDTDVARSSQEAVDQIIAAMKWLALDVDEGPFFQMQRLDRYKQVIDQMLLDGSAYRCYCTPEELEATRDAQRARGDKPRYDGRWRPQPGKVLPTPPANRPFVIRFKNPLDGDVSWNDLVKGPITISNQELDDLIICRPDGTPTYNFCVVVDDWDMHISHVIRGDDHVNNTPRQINILQALGAPLPEYGHLPMILGPDGEKLSKRHGAVSVLAYEEAGYLPDALINYLARLGWSHGDDELFSREQLVAWFDGTHLAKSPAQWDVSKLNWVNAQFIKRLSDEALAAHAVKFCTPSAKPPDLAANETLQQRCALFKDRCSTLVELADWLRMYEPNGVAPSTEDVSTHVTDAVRPALADLKQRLAAVEWGKTAIAAAFKEVLTAHQLKMPQLATAVRVLVCGRTQTPSIDAVLASFERGVVLGRLG